MVTLGAVTLDGLDGLLDELEELVGLVTLDRSSDERLEELKDLVRLRVVEMLAIGGLLDGLEELELMSDLVTLVLYGLKELANDVGLVELDVVTLEEWRRTGR